MALTREPLTWDEVNQRLKWSSLLATAVIRRATTLSLEELNADVAKQFAFDSYIIRLLEAPAEIRDQVRAQIGEDLRGLGEDAINLSLAGAIIQILTGYELLDDNNKRLFVWCYKTSATVATDGTELVVREHIVFPGHIPPPNIP